MDMKGDSSEISAGNKKHVIRNWRKGDVCYKVTKTFAELCSNVLWNVKLASD